MAARRDGPASPHFHPLKLSGGSPFSALLDTPGASTHLAKNWALAPVGDCVSFGIPFSIEQAFILDAAPLEIPLDPFEAQWLVFCHTSDLRPSGAAAALRRRGEGQLNELAAVYTILYQDGTNARFEIRRRHHTGAFERRWGENCFQAVEDHKPFPVHAPHEQLRPDWGNAQTRVEGWKYGGWVNWLCAWENPHPGKKITGLRLEPVSGVMLLSAVSAGSASEHPLRWRARQKAMLTLPGAAPFRPDLDENGLLAQIQLDLGQVISAQLRPIYPQEDWADSYNNKLPEISKTQVLIEYTAHPDACFHLEHGVILPAREVESENTPEVLAVIPTAQERVRLRVLDATSRQPVAVKLHLHGLFGEYLAPVDRHRILNAAWFEDYSVDFTHLDLHPCTYIDGETTVNLPRGKVFLEVSKGFEIRPIRKIVEIAPGQEELTLEVEKVLSWRERGWVTADTHVHFLSPTSAMLEGAGEGVNIVNLLASQWGELMTNVGDFDGKTTWGVLGAGGEGEYLVRVGTENRQHVLGHISLLGYRGRIIAPMTTAGPDESALGDPLESLLTEWARQCHRQGGLVVLPHFPEPRAEHAASIVAGEIDAVEMTSWQDLYSGIDPYSLVDWYRYLNCGHLVAAVGGTDKMSASTAVGTVRTYAHIPTELPFTYEHWMQAVRRAETFVTYGPLIEFFVDGRPMGSQLHLPAGGGTLDVTWQVASVTIPMTQVELLVNGEVVQAQAVDADGATGSWSVKVERSSWLALLVRGGYPDKAEMIAAHSSPVMVHVDGSQLLAPADAISILEQIEGALAYLDTIGTRADERAYKRMRLELISAQRLYHNRLHQAGHFHPH